MGVKGRLTRAKREREIPEYAAMVRRILRAHGRRVGDADPEDLAELVAMRETLDAAIAVAVKGQRRNGFSWAAIGRGLGITRQAAQMAWGRIVEELEHAEMLELLAEHRDRLRKPPAYGDEVADRDDGVELRAAVGR